MRSSIALFALVLLFALTAASTRSQTNVIPAPEAGNHIGESCTVEFIVKSTGRVTAKQGLLIFLNSAPSRHASDNVTVVIDRTVGSSLESKANGNIEKYYLGKQIRVSGAIQKNKGAVEIRPTSAAQLQVTDANPPVDPREIPPPPEYVSDDFDPRPPSYLWLYFIGFGLAVGVVWFVLRERRKKNRVKTGEDE